MKELQLQDNPVISLNANQQENGRNQFISESQEHFFTAQNGLRKRKIFLNVRYSNEESKWIKQVHQTLKRQKKIELTKKETLLRYYYSSNLQLEPCIEKLAHYYQWFNSEQIQTVSKEAKTLLQSGFVYTYGLTKEGRAFIIMNIGNMDFENFKLINFYQAINHVNNKVIHDKFVPGKIETYDYVLDLNEKFLSLPISSIKQIIKTFSDVYSMRLQNMYVINCTHLAKWLYHGIQKVINEQTSKKIKLFTKQEIEEGVLREFIDENILQRKMGGRHPDVIHVQDQANKQSLIQKFDQTQYFSVEQENSMFVGKKEEIPCCGTGQCIIY